MVYYPLSTLMEAGIHEVLIISTPQDAPRFEQLLGDGSQWGMKLQYAVQHSPDGLAQAVLIGEEFLADAPSALVLGNNIFFGQDLQKLLMQGDACEVCATMFAHHVLDPERYEVVSFDAAGTARSIEEKPFVPNSNCAVTGRYFYDSQLVDIAKTIKPSAHGELKMTAVNQDYLERGELNVQIMRGGYAWLDTGAHDSLPDAGQFVAKMEHREGLKNSCPEEIPWRNSFIGDAQLAMLAEPLAKSGYGQYLLRLLREPSQP